jgi:endogenous inhibitor of DNA gyrase (YacG/DUF329 family)
MSRCPTCAQPAEPRPKNAAFTFCSPRCRLVDLGKWLKEEYRVPVAGASDDDGDEQPTSQKQEQE